MLKELMEKAKSMMATQKSCTGERFNDPLASQVSWSPAKGGGSSFQTHRLVAKSANRVEFTITFGAKLFAGIFFLVGIGVMIGGIASAFPNGNFEFRADVLFLLPFGSVFAMVGFFMFYFMSAPIVFDGDSGYFWKGRKRPGAVIDKSKIKVLSPLADIYALQIISEYCRGDKSSYYSYELNLVLVDGTRLNVVDHGNIKKLRSDVKVLTDFLNVPIWDAVS